MSGTFLSAVLEQLSAASGATTATMLAVPPEEGEAFTLKRGQWYLCKTGHYAQVDDSVNVNGKSGFKINYFQKYNGDSRFDWFVMGPHGEWDYGCDPRVSVRERFELAHLLDNNGKPIPNKRKKLATTEPAQTVEKMMGFLGQLNEAATRQIVTSIMDERGHQLSQAMAERLAPAVDVVINERMAKAMAERIDVKTIEVKVRDQVNVVHSPHPKLQDAIAISSAIPNVWLCGPAGSGKTTLAGQLAEALGTQFGFISCTTGMSESKLLGRMNVHGTYLPAEFVRIYEEGGVFLWDEFDAADPNVVLCANAAMANGRLAVPDRTDRPVANRHKDTVLVIATNTWGRGSTSEYTARESLDAATRDRFVLSKIEVGYSPLIEAQFLGAYDSQPTALPTQVKSNRSLPNLFQHIRGNIDKHHLRRVLSTRVFAQAAALRAIGWDDQRIIGQFFLDWTKQEIEKALEGI